MCLAKDAKRTAKAMTRPPTTAVSRVDLRRQTATTSGARKKETNRLVEPIQTVKENEGG
jgi:hypothetical protein